MTTFQIKTKTAIVFFFLTAIVAAKIPYDTPARQAFADMLNIVSFFFLIILIFKLIKFFYRHFRHF